MAVETVPVGAVGATSTSGMDPNAQGVVIDPNAQVAPPSGSAEATPATPSTAGDAPGDQASAPSAESSDEGWKEKLPANVRSQVDRVITDLRQKDAEKVRAMETQVTQVQWAVELNRLLGSANPQERAQGRSLLTNTLKLVEGQTAPEEPAPDPLAGVDWLTADSYIPGIGAAFQHLTAQNQALSQQLRETAGLAEGTARSAAEKQLDGELSTLEAWATKNNLPFDRQKVLDAESELGVADLKKAYFATYGETLLEAGKQAAFKSLQTKKQAALPGASPSAGVVVQPPQHMTMAEAYEWAKHKHGVTGPLDFSR